MTTIFWAGDSTVQYNDILTFPQTGIGQVMNLFLKPEVRVENHAKNGRSTKSFIDESRLTPIYDKITAGDFLFIQFGHNDEKKNDPQRYTDPHSDYMVNLEKFVETDIKEQEGNILKGFSTGGYTGTGATDEIKGYVHGNEWVVNSAQVNAIGGPDAVKNMVQKEIIQKNTKIQTTKLEYSNNKSDIIDKVMTGQDIIINGFNAILSKIDEIIDYNEERRNEDSWR
jgi:hypothetical protein